MEYRNKRSLLLGMSLAVLVAAVMAGLLLQIKRPTPATVQVQLHDAIQVATAENKNILVLFGASW